MASKPLNPSAPEFVPGSFTESWVSTDECSEVRGLFMKLGMSESVFPLLCRALSLARLAVSLDVSSRLSWVLGEGCLRPLGPCTHHRCSLCVVTPTRGACAQIWRWAAPTCFSCNPTALQDHITPEELAELEAAEGWVSMLAEFEDMEDEHLIAVALR